MGILRSLLRLLGTLALVAGGILILIAISFASDDPDRFYGLLGTFLFDAVLFGAGYLLFALAAHIRTDDDDDEPAEAGARVHKLGIVLIAILVIELGVCLPPLGRIILMLFVLLTLARLYTDWSTQPLIGRFSFADIYDFIVQAVLFLGINLILAALTEGRGGGGFSGGGGLSGGGGASGSW